jgi:GR25 family glycosyltransferase involved in LPS biosynthesis
MGFFDIFFKDTLNNYFDTVQVIVIPKREEYVKNVFSYSNMNINYIKFNAINGDNLDIKKLISEKKLSVPNKLKHRNEVACYLSHISLIQKFYDTAIFNNSTLFVFEDDIIIDTEYPAKVKKVMNDVPSNWEFINFGRCWDDCKSTKKVSVDASVGTSTRSLCAHSYAITKVGAKKILEHAFPIVNPVDIYYNSLVSIAGLKFYSAIPRIFNQIKSLTVDRKIKKNLEDDAMGSTLENNDTCLECRD